VRRVLAAFLLVACSHPDVPDFDGVRLGMAPRDVRDRFTGAAGTWTNDAVKDDYAIKWASPPESATFEFHTGALVAVRADLPSDAPFAKGDDLVVTKAAVLKRSHDGGRVHVDLLARDCPTHAAEAKKLTGE
jgi:hypothetical protein